jgi:hypothetical protein
MPTSDREAFSKQNAKIKKIQAIEFARLMALEARQTPGD